MLKIVLTSISADLGPIDIERILINSSSNFAQWESTATTIAKIVKVCTATIAFKVVCDEIQLTGLLNIRVVCHVSCTWHNRALCSGTIPGENSIGKKVAQCATLQLSP